MLSSHSRYAFSMREIVNWIGELLNIFVHLMIAAPIYKMIVTGLLLKAWFVLVFLFYLPNVMFY